ncbi:hypothetical protein EDB92DRAFT_1814833 [Lactarius akahatsu]|uniref:Uncharacterized protein n=1 Tax=Lactarius akahatsu TaxID=416441 RepID=A0AAD4LK52_9AGAM|nr:hypothetical protein EDB92DRAFT_1814833 [Lactarius akahatsu]
MVKPPPPLTPTDAHESSLSEIDSVSDSDWLDISASEDANSIGIPESDRDEVEDRPLSRRSFSSRSSSRDGDVDIWEGLVESTDDEALEEPTEFPLGPSPLGQSSFTNADGYSAEERRVEDALNQSMVSTLSTSRAGSMSASGTSNHPASRARDLRLSFPDPLSSSKDELIRPSEEFFSSSTPLDVPQLSELSDDEDPSEIPPSPQSTLSNLPNFPSVEFEIFLYGTPPEHKWSVIENLLEKWGASSGLTVSERHPQCNRTSTYWLHPKGSLHHLSLGRAVSVIDNMEAHHEVGVALPYSLTVDIQLHQSNTEPVLDKQSLAIVFLPTYRSSLPSHTLFLPVIATTFHGLSVDERERQVYQQQWNIYNVPKKQLLFPGAATVLAADEVGRIEASEVARAFEHLQPLRRKIFRGVKNQVATTPAVTIMAILSIVLGYIVSSCSPLPVPAMTFTEKPDPTSAVGLVVNFSEHSTAPFVTPISSAISITSLRDFSVAIISTPPSDLSTTPTIRRGAEEHNDKPINVAVASESRSLIVSQQSPSSLSEISIRSKALAVFQQAVEQATLKPTEASTVTTKPKGETMYSLSTRLASSLSEMFNVKVLAGVLRADMKELLDALDELLRALSTQAASAVRVTEGLRDKLRRRNQHAQQKARAIREKGERVVSSLGERARSHVEQARSRARALKEVISAEVADVYEKHHGRGFSSEDARAAAAPEP